jgi:hypothetical protein
MKEESDHSFVFMKTEYDNIMLYLTEDNGEAFSNFLFKYLYTYMRMAHDMDFCIDNYSTNNLVVENGADVIFEELSQLNDISNFDEMEKIICKVYDTQMLSTFLKQTSFMCTELRNILDIADDQHYEEFCQKSEAYINKYLKDN